MNKVFSDNRSRFSVHGLSSFWGILLVFVTTCACAAGPSGTAGAPAICVKTYPEAIPPGGVGLVRITVPSGAVVTHVQYLKRDYPAFRKDGHHWFALTGAGLRVSPGRHTVTVRWRYHGESHVYVASLPVLKKRYPEEHLKVSARMVNFPPDILKRVIDDQKAVRRACSRITRDHYWHGPFIWPVNSKVLSPFGLRRFFNGQPRSPHSGVDLRAGEGTPIVAPNDGVVVLSRKCYLSGNTLVIDHGAGLFTLYAHLSKFKVKEGQKVRKGQVIGLAGATGRVTGPHLHYGVSLLGTRVDPQQFMKVASRL